MIIDVQPVQKDMRENIVKGKTRAIKFYNTEPNEGVEIN